MLISRKIQRTIGRFAVGVFSFCIITVCWLFIVSTLTGCTSEDAGQLDRPSIQPTEHSSGIDDPNGNRPAQITKPTTSWVLTEIINRHGVVVVPVHVQVQQEYLDQIRNIPKDNSLGTLNAATDVYNGEFYRELGTRMKTLLDMPRERCVVTGISILPTKFVRVKKYYEGGEPPIISLPSDALVLLKCPETADAGTPK